MEREEEAGVRVSPLQVALQMMTLGLVCSIHLLVRKLVKKLVVKGAPSLLLLACTATGTLVLSHYSKVVHEIIFRKGPFLLPFRRDRRLVSSFHWLPAKENVRKRARFFPGRLVIFGVGKMPEARSAKTSRALQG